MALSAGSAASEPLIRGTTIDDCIAHHHLSEPTALCFALWQGGQWRPYSRADFWSRVEHYAAHFARAFSAPTSILFIKRLDVDLLAAYVGAMRAGHTPAQLSYQSQKLSASEYQRKLENALVVARAQGVFCDRPYELGSLLERPGLTVLSPDACHETLESIAPRTTDHALIQFSSGSTGLQKGVLLTHRAVIAHMRHYAPSLRLSSQDRLISWLPLYHDMGLVACFLMPLMCGVPVYQMDPFDWIVKPDLLLEAIETHRATICFLPNFAYHVLASKGKPHDLSSMRCFVNCSEPARMETHEAFLRRFPSVRTEALTVCYALAENTFAVAQGDPAESRRSRELDGKHVLSCGRVLPGTEVAILDPGPTGVGEIALRGDCLFDQYLEGKPSMTDGYYRTGDLGYLSPDGEVFITGRKQDLIIVNGKNIYPQDVEAASSGVPGVYPGRVVAFGVPSDQTGSEELYVLVERDGSVPDTPLKMAVQKAVEGEVGLLPRRVEVLDHMRLVKTSSGKISRSRNKELFFKGALR